MTLNEIHEALGKRTPIEHLPLQWREMGYTTEWFNSAVAAPDFSGWDGDFFTPQEVGVIAELLRVQPGEALLDIACGYGRHALPLAKDYGLRVTGIDISPGLIEAAKRFAQEQGVNIAYEAVDAKDIAWHNTFQHAMVAFNSFSLFSPEDAPVVLKAIHRSLKPTGPLFLDLNNKPFERQGYLRNNPSRDWAIWPGGLTLQEVYFHDDVGVEVCRDLIFKTTATQVETFTTLKRIYSADEIVGLLSYCDFQVEALYGNWDLAVLNDDSPKMLLVAVKR